MPLTTLVSLPRNMNVLPDGSRIVNARQATMLTLLGNPRADYGSDCRDITNPRLKPLVTRRNVGPFAVRGLAPAVDSLEGVMKAIEKEEPKVFAALGTAGMLCARFVRGSTTSISNHSWGTAIDLTLDGVLDARGDGRVQEGLTRIAPIFNRHEWFWGAAFGTEDGMHFECSDGLIRKWANEGRFGAVPVALPEDDLLSLGDRGPEVEKLQEKLNQHGAGLLVDGIFGRDTQSAVMRFQGAHKLTIDGVVGKQTSAALGL
ncbi:peptidoglycan-binding protein [Roseomonas populi]|uniref:Peptidoglycan-binding protein n=1 Tax=Roseomonas populi TaxID=3121582 RepID=A0ABT1XAB1_9PROT|nr:peptidoglycan-binding protein [Roseomonas pecuniae]MCR0984691.1 peptidoglycan-binding protein [Roseomonas pecuniae]